MEGSQDRHGDDRIDGLVCDLDGVVYRGDRVVAGAPEAIDALRRAGVRVVFCTNNSRPTVVQYVEKLKRLGVDASPSDIVTSAVVTAKVLTSRGLGGARALAVGGDGVRESLEAIGIEVVGADDASDRVDLVVVGWDPRFDYNAMRAAAAAVHRGATLIATNSDATFPAPDGLWPGAGAILASIQTASGVAAEVMGKPHEPMMDAVAARLDGARSIGIVGDRPDTDLAGGAARGWTTILVLSGVTDAAGAARLEPQPDLVLDSLADLPAAL
ncbi:MAG: HAD-IIA family hydrolase [Actinomycetota bacterium]|nr:HAD-IIA family hydrolase [Actinomycetota bacterium]